MTVCELRKALEQFAPNAEVVLCDGTYKLTPTNIRRDGDYVYMDIDGLDTRETNP